MSQLRLLYDEWNRYTLHKNPCPEVLDNDFVRGMRENFDGEGLVRFLFSVYGEWGWYETSLIYDILNDGPEIPEECRGHVQACHERWLAWGKERGYVA